MPELPEVEHVVRALRPVVVGRTIVDSEVRLRKLIGESSSATFIRRLKQATITGVSRRGKYILLECQKLERKRGQRTISGRGRENMILAVHRSEERRVGKE